MDPTHPRATPVSADDLEATAPRPDTWIGRVIDGRYRLDSRLAAGGMGEVFKATHVELGRSLALKMMKPELSAEPSFVDRFRREAMTASRLGHPHIVDIIDSGRADTGQFYFVMEFLDGEPLSDLIGRGPTAPALVVDLARQMAEALDVAHRAGVVHRDLKPDNVIVLQRVGKPFVKLVDFGIAKVVTPAPDQKQTTVGIIMGTPQYMAPEQAAGVALDARADVYALGLILYELLTGRPPFVAETAALVMSAHISTPPPPLPGEVPKPLRELVTRMLAKRPGERPSSMAEVLEALQPLDRPEPKRRAAFPWLLGSVGGVVLLGAAVMVSLHSTAPPEVPLVPPTPSPPLMRARVAEPQAAVEQPVAVAPEEESVEHEARDAGVSKAKEKGSAEKPAAQAATRGAGGKSNPRKASSARDAGPLDIPTVYPE